LVVQEDLKQLPVRLTNSPDFLSLPAARPDESLGCGSSFQVRYVSASLLFFLLWTDCYILKVDAINKLYVRDHRSR